VLCENLFLHKFIEKLNFKLDKSYLSPAQQLHHDVYVLFVLEDVVHLYYVGVIDLLQDIDFVLKTNTVIFIKLASR